MCASIIRALIKHKKLDEQEIANICMLPEKICRSVGMSGKSEE